MSEQEFTEAVDAMNTEEVREHFEALMALALSIEDNEEVAA